jgi:hypothetical protein
MTNPINARIRRYLRTNGSSGWYVYYRKTDGQKAGKGFFDIRYGSSEASYKAAEHFSENIKRTLYAITKPTDFVKHINLSKRNTVGVGGVWIVTGMNNYQHVRASASIHTPGKSMLKQFSIKKWGLEEATRKAIEWRKMKEIEMFGASKII